MCNKECICKKCKNGPCGVCKYNKELIDKCRTGGIEECKYFKELKEDNNENNKR